MYYDFTFSDGSTLFGKFLWVGEEHAKLYGLNIVSKKEAGNRTLRAKISDKPGRLKDGFREGWNPGLGEYVTGRKHHEKLLKEKGLVEIGDSQLPKKQETKELKYFTEDTIKALANTKGCDISGNQAEKLLKDQTI